jgi:sugar O-acyltransferase (sialic acid O-acetyltransferase NeuD family)
MKPNIIIIGAGGHGKVVYDAIISQDKYQVIGFVDAQLPVNTSVIGQVKVICKQDDVANLANQAEYFIAAIGNNEIRAKVYQTLISKFKPATIIHSTCVLGSDIKIGEGTVVLANAIINSFSQVGINSIINSGVIVDHECQIGNHVYLKLGTIASNNMQVADFYTSEIGEIIKK